MSAVDMDSHHRNQLLDALMHYAPLDVRHKVMAEVPLAYAAYHRFDPEIGMSVTDAVLNRLPARE